MNNKIEQTFIDKGSWPDGPWKSEPDFVSWTDEKTGYNCVILRQEITGHLCGYVCVSKGHPAYKKDILHDLDDIDIHGGLTYAESSLHTPLWIILNNDERWWLGFDCAHNRDHIPLHNKFEGQVYRNIEYVISECESLAHQLKKMKD